MKVMFGFLLAFTIGVVCRLAAIPLPAPPMLIGALLVVAMTLGYAVTDKLATRRRPLTRGPSNLSGEVRP